MQSKRAWELATVAAVLALAWIVMTFREIWYMRARDADLMKACIALGVAGVFVAYLFHKRSWLVAIMCFALVWVSDALMAWLKTGGQLVAPWDAPPVFVFLLPLALTLTLMLVRRGFRGISRPVRTFD